MAKAKKSTGVLSRIRIRKKLNSVTVEDVVASLPKDVVAQAAQRAEEIQRSARVTQKDLQLEITM